MIITVEQNTTGIERTGTVTVSALDSEGNVVATEIVTIDQEPQDSLSATPLILDYDALGEPAQTVTVATSADSYVASPDDSWIVVTQNNGTFTVEPEVNETGVARTGTVTINAGTADEVVVTVNQAPRDLLTVTPPTYNVGGGDNSPYTYTVTASTGTYSATADVAWVDIVESVGSFTVSANTDNTGSERTATITVTSGTATPVVVTFVQAAGGTLVVTPSDYEVSADDLTEYTYTVTLTGQATYTVTSPDTWITIVESAGSFTVAANEVNPEAIDRTATITVTAPNIDPVVVTFTQLAPDTLSADPTVIEVEALLGLEVTTTVNASLGVYLAVADAPWLSVIQAGNLLTIIALTNLTGAQRTGIVTLTSGNAEPVIITVIQDGTVLLDVNPTSLTFSYSGEESQTVDVTSNAPVYTAEANEDWINVVVDAAGFDVTVLPHEGEDIRNAKIIVNDDYSSEFEVAVEQLFPPFTHRIEIDFADEDKTFRFGPDSEWETQTTKVITNADYADLKCEADSSWIYVDMQLVGPDPYILVRCEPNATDNETGGEERTGYVTVSSSNGYPASMRIIQGKKW